jgi:hypothetical protein
LISNRGGKTWFEVSKERLEGKERSRVEGIINEKKEKAGSVGVGVGPLGSGPSNAYPSSTGHLGRGRGEGKGGFGGGPPRDKHTRQTIFRLPPKVVQSLFSFYFHSPFSFHSLELLTNAWLFSEFYMSPDEGSHCFPPSLPNRP